MSEFSTDLMGFMSDLFRNAPTIMSEKKRFPNRFKRGK